MCAVLSHSVVSESLWPHELYPARLLCPWDFPGKKTGVGCHFLLHYTQGYTQGCSLLQCKDTRLNQQRESYLGWNSQETRLKIPCLFEGSDMKMIWVCPERHVTVHVLLLLVPKSCHICDPMDCSTPGFLVLHYLPEFAQTHVHWVGDAIQASHLLSSPSPALRLSQHQGLSQWVSCLLQVAKVLELYMKCCQPRKFSWV